MDSTTLIVLLITGLIIYFSLTNHSYPPKKRYYSRELPRMDYDRPIDDIRDYPRYVYNQAPAYGAPASYVGISPIQLYPVQYGYGRPWGGRRWSGRRRWDGGRRDDSGRRWSGRRRWDGGRRDDRGRRWRRPRFAQDTLAKTESRRSTSPERPSQQRQTTSDTANETKSVK